MADPDSSQKPPSAEWAPARNIVGDEFLARLLRISVNTASGGGSNDEGRRWGGATPAAVLERARSADDERLQLVLRLAHKLGVARVD